MHRAVPDFVIKQLQTAATETVNLSNIGGHSITPLFDAVSLIRIGREQLLQAAIVAKLADELNIDYQCAEKMYARYLHKIALSKHWNQRSFMGFLFGNDDRVLMISKSLDISMDKAKLFLQIVGDTLLEKAVNSLFNKETGDLLIYNGIAYVLPHTIPFQMGLFAITYAAKTIHANTQPANILGQ